MSIDQGCAQAITRFALGITLAVSLSWLGDWPLAWLTPVVAGMLLAPPGRPFAPAVHRALLGQCLGVVLLSLVLTEWLLPRPGLYALAMAMGLFALYLQAEQGQNPLITAASLFAWLVIPLIGLGSTAHGFEAALGLYLSLVLGVVIAVVLYAFMPAPAGSAIPLTPRPLTPEGLRHAGLYTLLVLPLSLVCFLFELHSAIFLLMIVAMLVHNPGLHAGYPAGRNTLLANLLGGVVALVLHPLLMVLPTPLMLVPLIAWLSLVWGRAAFTSRLAPLLVTAFITLLILLGSTSGNAFMSDDPDVQGRMALRVLQATLATAYLIAGAGLFRALGWLPPVSVPGTAPNRNAAPAS
ncbi:DUF2955 domain-containing protein [Ferrimonas balearica]|uniref:DUF2955 domain-containing protein n=1 Tax=Ferrimonas balearica TaxID=44012 RepID=UPI001C991954|nr:DUF2955 domain-containing protein [Ferrimonas balearica]MBY5991145.1 DUF2955 domain-containing protein [Ferrimonas balearica]